jgi:hypothetical protein
VQGDLRLDGRWIATHARRGRVNDGPRLHGRIHELEPASKSFVMRVQAEVRNGNRTLLSPPVEVLVRAAAARIERNDSRISVPFADLAIADLVKVKWTSRTPVTGGPDVVVAREVEVTSGSGVAAQPEWEGRVQSVNIAANTIRVVPRNDDPIFLNGVSVAQVDVVLEDGVQIERRANSGGGDSLITIAGVVPGQDRIWWRGTVAGPSTVAATWVRVRQE